MGTKQKPPQLGMWIGNDTAAFPGIDCWAIFEVGLRIIYVGINTQCGANRWLRVVFSPSEDDLLRETAPHHNRLESHQTSDRTNPQDTDANCGVLGMVMISHELGNCSVFSRRQSSWHGSEDSPKCITQYKPTRDLRTKRTQLACISSLNDTPHSQFSTVLHLLRFL